MEHVKFILMVFMLPDNVTENLLFYSNACKTFVLLFTVKLVCMFVTSLEHNLFVGHC
jgi:hypothetical protein